MMLGLTKKLLYCYRKNSYEYYPFGYIKEKSFSETEQKTVLNYLQEITNWKEEKIRENKTASSSNSEEIEISGGGAYVAEPGTGKINEDGQYVFPRMNGNMWMSQLLPLMIQKNPMILRCMFHLQDLRKSWKKSAI